MLKVIMIQNCTREVSHSHTKFTCDTTIITFLWFIKKIEDSNIKLLRFYILDVELTRAR